MDRHTHHHLAAPTELRTFRAASMQEALAIVRQELGPDAVVVQTRQVRVRRRLPWRRREFATEITARIEPAENPRATRWESLTSEPLTPGDTARADVPHEARPGRVVDIAPAGSRFASMDSLLSQYSDGSRPTPHADIPDELFHLYAELIDAEVEDSDARELICELNQRRPEVPDDQLRRVLEELVARRIECCGPIRTTPGQRRVVALVGPTGVGKTTTIAKLAATLRLQQGVRTGLVTVDTYRVAAVEQLRTYADIMDLPMKVVTSPREMREAVEELSHLDLVLIDTAGRSPRDELRIQELRSFLTEADVDEVHLVVSLASSIRSLQMIADRFRPVGTTAMLLTKLDEAPAFGGILSAAMRVPLPISYFTTGQDVPDDIEPARADRAASLLLRHDGDLSLTDPAAR
ncbi:MAG: flagellar biosynthesis protein FlhF [Maioricimonas sp. JB049]